LVSREGAGVAVTRGTSYENRTNLAPQFFDTITKKYEGTRLGRQELMGELLLDVPGALWVRDRLDELRRSQAPTSLRIVVAIDPSGTGGEEADECGIVGVGVDADGTGRVLADASGRYQPTEWAKRAIELYHRLHANCIVAETNFGGKMVEATLRAIDRNVAYRAVTASSGKVARAEPVAALYEQGRVHHVGSFVELEDQMCAFTTAFDRTRAGFFARARRRAGVGIDRPHSAADEQQGLYELYRQSEAAKQRNKPQPIKSPPQPGSMEWFEAEKVKS
jgi:phage terminase large subunit-like protein